MSEADETGVSGEGSSEELGVEEVDGVSEGVFGGSGVNFERFPKCGHLLSKCKLYMNNKSTI